MQYFSTRSDQILDNLVYVSYMKLTQQDPLKSIGNKLATVAQQKVWILLNLDFQEEFSSSPLPPFTHSSPFLSYQ